MDDEDEEDEEEECVQYLILFILIFIFCFFILFFILDSRLPDGKIRSLSFLGLRQGGGCGGAMCRNPRKGRDLILQRSLAEP